MRLLIILIGLLLLTAYCKPKTQWNYEAFFEQNFKLINENSIKKNEINWIDLKKIVRDSIKQFSTNEDVYNAIDYTIKLIKDGHSIFVKPNTPNRLDIDSLSIPKITSRIINRNIGYLKIPGFVANDSLSRLFALAVRKSLIELDKANNLVGWIIDLKNNGGGKGSSMLLGISPLFADSLVGYALNNSGRFIEMYCTNHFGFGIVPIDSLLYESNLINNNRKIAVIVNDKTASAGELLTLAFRSQKNTKIIGTKTKGKTSHLRLFSYSKSNAKLLLATEYFCDNKKNIFKGSIIPDTVCLDTNSLELAIKYLTVNRDF